MKLSNLFLVLFVLIKEVRCFSSTEGPIFHKKALHTTDTTLYSCKSQQRRSFIVMPFATIAASIAFQTPLPSNALDMDAFIKSELESDKKKDFTDDEALCKFGAPGRDKGEACVRAGLSTAGAKSGGVDAYGKIDRGTFERCKKKWDIVNGKYEFEVICE